MKRAVSKILAFVMALLLWAAINLERQGMESVEARVRYSNVPAGMEVNPDLAGEFTAVVRGPRRRLEELMRDGLALEVDCSEMAAGEERTVSVSGETLGLPGGVDFVKAVPSQVRVALEPTVTRDVEIVPRFTGDREPGYRLEEYWVEPERLKVVGPEARVALVDAVVTDPIDLSGLVGTHSFQTTAYLSDPYVRFDGEPQVVVDVRMQRR